MLSKFTWSTLLLLYRRDILLAPKRFYGIKEAIDSTKKLLLTLNTLAITVQGVTKRRAA